MKPRRKYRARVTQGQTGKPNVNHEQRDIIWGQWKTLKNDIAHIGTITFVRYVLYVSHILFVHRHEVTDENVCV